MTNHRFLACVLLFVIASAAPPPAAAAPEVPGKAAADADAVKRAEAFYNQGVRLYSDKKWKAAEVAFRAAWALNPTFDVAYNLGSTLYQLGDHRGAAEHLAFALRRWPLLGATSSLRQVAQKRFDEARASVGGLTVRVNVAQAEVLVDGKPVGRSPLEATIFVEPGAHTVEAKLDGYRGAAETLHATRGGTHAVSLVLAPEEAAPAIAPPSGPAPAAEAEERAAAALGPAPGPAPVPARRSTPAPADRPSPLVLGAGVTVGVAFGAAGVGAFVASNRESHNRAELLGELGGPSPCWPGSAPGARCDEVADASAAERTFRALAIAGFVASGAALGATLAYALWPRAGGGTPESLRVVPAPSAQGGGVEVVGTF